MKALVNTPAIVTLLLCVQVSFSYVSQCPEPTTPRNGRILYHSERSSYVIFTCDAGYKMRGSPSALCMLGRWSPQAPKCIPVDSLHMSKAQTTTRKVHSFMETGVPLQVTTPFPFKLGRHYHGQDIHRRSVGPQAQPIMQKNVEPNCDAPPAIPNGFVVVSRMHPRNASFYCNNGYQVSFRSLECVNGVWNKNPPRCVPLKNKNKRPMRPISNKPNPCRGDYGGCDHKCNFDGRIQRCECEKGYQQDGKACRAARPKTKPLRPAPAHRSCQKRNGGCSQICFGKQDGTAGCLCRSGFYIPRHNRKTCVDVNECMTKNFGCSHTCINTRGSAICDCPLGFKLEADRKTCKDIDECLSNNFHCSHFCVNTNGSAYCVCPDHLTLADNNKTCVERGHLQYQEPTTWDVGIEGSGYEAQEAQYDDISTQLAPRTTSRCPAGFRSRENTCEDINECVEKLLNCSDGCENTNGSAYCTCPMGYRLSTDHSTCIDINECEEKLLGCSGGCENTNGSAKCTCPPGHHLGWDQKTCFDVDECWEEPPACSQFCFNTKGSFICSCRPGYRLSSLDNSTCTDIDECSERTHRCSDICKNRENGYDCDCYPGRILRRSNFCEDCPRNTYHVKAYTEYCQRCPPESHTNGTGKASITDCICDDGYRGSPSNNMPCEDINECEEKLLNCSHSCVNTFGSAHCTCPVGFRLAPDNRTCTDIDECSDSPHICDHICTNTVGSYQCSCRKGYAVSPQDKHVCLDDDECEFGNHGCSHICVNFDGGFYCQCPPGYKMTGNMRTCAEITCPPLPTLEEGKINCTKDSKSKPKMDTTCTITCNDGYTIKGYNKLDCLKNGTWSHGLPLCISKECPPLKNPSNGHVLPERCVNASGNILGSKCYYGCESGYRAKETEIVTTCIQIQGVMQWRRPPVTCIKIAVPASIACPPDTTFRLPPGESAMQPELPMPITNVDPDQIHHSFEPPIGKDGYFPHGYTAVTYVAFDSYSGTRANCSFGVYIKDEEPPKVVNCPSTIPVLITTLDGISVNWSEPVFSDNVKLEHVTRSQEPGSIFTFGVHHVRYVARDTDGNEAVCEFQVNVTRKECKYPADIQHGSTECYDWLEGVTCEPTCDEGYTLPSNVSMFYSCDLTGVWEPRSWIPDCQEILPSPPEGCLPGSEFFEGGEGEDSSCVECPPGMYSSTAVAQCQLCEPGFYQDRPGQTYCDPCPTNKTTVQQLSPLLEQQCFS